MKSLDETVAKAQAEAIDERKAKGKVIMVEVDHPEFGKLSYPMIKGIENSISHSYNTKFKGSNGKAMCRDVRMSVKMDKDGKAAMDSYSVDEHEDWDAKKTQAVRGPY